MGGKRVEGKRIAASTALVDSRAGAAQRGSVSKGDRSTARIGRDTPHRVRIIGGRWKRTQLIVVDAPGLRPSPDRVRETLFNWLEHFVPDFTALKGLDLFAGTGALGLELASRGAARVTLIEQNAKAAAALQRASAKLAADNVELVVGDALEQARRYADGSFNVVFIDPPFGSGLLLPALSEAARMAKGNGWIYVESAVPLSDADAAARGLAIVRKARAGRVHAHLLRHASA
jgi:16S rRNA (guanine966-N2)-methyltransferase